MEFFQINSLNKQLYNKALLEFEYNFCYPLGTDTFKIVHGEDYFDFFERMGQLYYSGFQKNDVIIAASAAVRRFLNTKYCWYLCDLKINATYQGRFIPAKLLRKGILSHKDDDQRAYGISMNDANNQSTPIIDILKKSKAKPFKNGPIINIYSLDFYSLKKISDRLEAINGPIRYISLQGVKDIVLQSNGQRMNLIHLDFPPYRNDAVNHVKPPDPNAVYMFCTIQGSLTHKLLQQEKITINATATIIHFGMDDWDWSFIRTYEI
jgi:hypothetical protein